MRTPRARGEAGLDPTAVAISVVAKALKHPLRVGLIEHVGREGRISPSRFADLYADKFAADQREAITEASYHSRALVNLGAFEVASFAPGLRGTEHRLYGLKDPIGQTASNVTQALLGNSFFMTDNEEGVMFSMEEGQVVGVARAFDHPTRLAILRDMQDSTFWSPARWARSRESNLGAAAYHFRALAGLRVVRLVNTVGNRGAIEHLYDLSGSLAVAVVTTLHSLEGRAEVASIEVPTGK